MLPCAAYGYDAQRIPIRSCLGFGRGRVFSSECWDGHLRPSQMVTGFYVRQFSCGITIYFINYIYIWFEGVYNMRSNSRCTYFYD